jgi:hypothetical protein
MPTEKSRKASDKKHAFKSTSTVCSEYSEYRKHAFMSEEGVSA